MHYLPKTRRILSEGHIASELWADVVPRAEVSGGE